jgi:16S rRNA (cytosine1402-N4)-methyltransferase
MTAYDHIPAMLSEAIQYLNLEPGKIIVDGTLGGAGHAKAICGKILPDGLLIGIDQDPDAVESAKHKLAPYASNIRLFHDNFGQLQQILQVLGLDGVHGILLDLGLSLHHLRASKRGFSFKAREVLDMRMNPGLKTTAEDIVNRMKEESLASLFKDLGEERYARQIARKIVERRGKERIRYSDQLADLVSGAIPGPSRFNRKIHPATQVFMALRIAVNRELEVLEQFMEDLPGYLLSGGRFCVLSYHSLEDRIVKQRLRAFEKGCTCPPAFPKCLCDKKPVMKPISRKAIRPSMEEVLQNPMARSVKMRVAEKI